MGVEGEDGDARVVAGKVAVEAGGEDAQLLHDVLAGDGLAEAADGQVRGYEGHTQFLGGEYHQRLGAVAVAGLEVFGVAGEGECLALDVLFVDGSSDQCVHLSGAQVGHGGFKGSQGVLAGLGTAHAGLGLHVVGDVDYRGKAVLGLCGVVYLVELHSGQVHHAAVVRGGTCRAVDDGGEEFKNFGVFEGFEDNLVAYAIGVACCDCDFH